MLLGSHGLPPVPAGPYGWKIRAGCTSRTWRTAETTIKLPPMSILANNLKAKNQSRPLMCLVALNSTPLLSPASDPLANVLDHRVPDRPAALAHRRPGLAALANLRVLVPVGCGPTCTSRCGISYLAQAMYMRRGCSKLKAAATAARPRCRAPHWPSSSTPLRGRPPTLLRGPRIGASRLGLPHSTRCTPAAAGLSLPPLRQFEGPPLGLGARLEAPRGPPPSPRCRLTSPVTSRTSRTARRGNATVAMPSSQPCRPLNASPRCAAASAFARVRWRRLPRRRPPAGNLRALLFPRFGALEVHPR